MARNYNGYKIDFQDHIVCQAVIMILHSIQSHFDLVSSIRFSIYVIVRALKSAYVCNNEIDLSLIMRKTVNCGACVW